MHEGNNMGIMTTLKNLPQKAGGGQGDTSIPLGGSSPPAGETKATMRSTPPLESPVDDPTQPPKPDAALPTATQTARP
jgi:hypothetical protein